VRAGTDSIPRFFSRTVLQQALERYQVRYAQARGRLCSPSVGEGANFSFSSSTYPLTSSLADNRQPTGKESLVEKWILHKLNLAAEKVNAALVERNFMAATSEAYSFWLYEICDVYIEAIKLVTDPSYADAEARRSAQNTLYTVLDNGLRLLHPFMPYVTEELWQRLPRRPTDKTPSIMLAKFPEAVRFTSLLPYLSSS
jgi:valyl-tRNA synthetase